MRSCCGEIISLLAIVRISRIVALNIGNQIVSQLIPKKIERIIAAIWRACKRLAIGRHDDKRFDLTIADEIVHDLLHPRGLRIVKAPLILVSANTVHQIQHIILFALIITGRKIDKGLLLHIRAVSHIILRHVGDGFYGSAFPGISHEVI